MTPSAQLRPGWRLLRFGDVVHEVKNTTKNPAADGFERVVGLDHLDSASLPLRRWDELCDLPDGTTFTRTFRAGQVLFGKRRAYQRKVAVPRFDGICSSDILVFEPSSPDLLSEFLAYLVQTEGFFNHALGTSAGSLSPRTKWQELAKYEFALPPLDEQKRIAELLHAVAIDTTRTEEVIGAIDAAAVAFSADQWLRQLAAQEPLGELASVTVGIVVKPADLYVDASQPAAVPALRSLNVLPNRLNWEEVVRISQEAHRSHRKSGLSAGDVVVVRSGRPGDAVVIPQGLGDVNCVDLLIVRCGDRVLPDYLSRYLNSPQGSAAMLGRSAGTAEKHLNAGQLKKVAIPVLPRASQEEMIENLAAFDAARAQAASKLVSGRRLLAAIREEVVAGGRT